MNPRGVDVMEQYPGHWLILIVDGAEMLVASLDRNRRDVHQAIWTSSVTMSWIFHCSFSAEIMTSVLIHHIDAGATAEQLRAAVAPFAHTGIKHRIDPSPMEEALARCGTFFEAGIPGYEALLDRFGYQKSWGRVHQSA